MKRILIFTLLLSFINLFSQKNIKVYHEKKGDTLVLYADNLEIYPMSFVFSGMPELENMKSLEAFKQIQVMPAKSVKNKVTYFMINDKTKRWAVKKMPGYEMYVGDVTLEKYDSDYQYVLPFAKGKSFTVNQGYNGLFSHQNENSLDFTMPEGTEIVAAREGLVTDVVKHNNTGCAKKSCAD